MAEPKNGRRIDPYGAFNFEVQIDDIIVGGFSEVSGLKIETEVYTIKEGGMNSFEHKLPKSTKFSDITFKRGI
ncbi:MAG TPA: phage tail protein, partial [Candidatus Methanoperedens sp.]